MGLFKRYQNGVWYARYNDASGKKIIVSTGTKVKAEAAAKLVRIQSLVQDEKLGIDRPTTEKIRFSELAQMFLDNHAKRTKASWKDDEQRIRDHLTPTLGKLWAHQIDDKRISQLMRTLSEKTVPRSSKQIHLSKATINRTLALCRSILRKAKTWGYLSSVPEFRLHKESHRMRFLSSEEEKALLASCDGELLAFVIFMLNTALRPGEARRLEWAHVDMDAKSVTVRGKGDKLRKVPLNKKARAALEGLERKSDLVFPGMQHNLPRFFRLALKRAEINSKGEQKVVPHSLRHTALSRMAHKGADVASLQKLAGHASITTTQRYLHSRDLKNTVELLDD